MTSHKSRGFTLVELMITIAVLAIGSALAYPSFSSVLRSNRVATSTNNVIAAVNLARSEAIRNNRGGGICPSNAGTQCDGVDWNVGYLAYSDADASGGWSAGDTGIRFFEPNDALELTVIANGGGVTQLSFDRSGRSNVDATLNLKVADCKAGEQYQRNITLTRSGQTRMKKETCQ